MLRSTISLISFLVLATPIAHAEEILTTHKLANNIYALVGPMTNRTPDNFGNNANFGVIVTDEGVILIDSGGTYKGAEMIDLAIKTITDKPVKVVINSGGQDHRWLGNHYFKAKGANIIANEKAVQDQKARVQDQMFMLGNLVEDAGLEGTEAAYADQTFTEKKTVSLGGVELEIIHAGHAHTPGDSYIWLPNEKIVFSGDIVYVDRMLGVGSQSAHVSWIEAFESMASLQPKIIVPGHGAPTSLEKATAETYDYLVFLRKSVQEFMDDGNGLESIGKLDQSQFSHLGNYDTLKGRNAQRVFEELEWE